MDRINLFLSKKVIGVSEAVSSRFKINGNISKKYITIYNGVDLEAFEPTDNPDFKKGEMWSDYADDMDFEE